MGRARSAGRRGDRRDKQEEEDTGAVRAKEERAKEGGKQGEGQGGEGTIAGSGDLVAQRSAEVAKSGRSVIPV